jgi:hypothetical protein
LIRRLHIAGSANANTDPDLLRDAHVVVAAVVDGWVTRGGALVSGLGGEPHASSDPEIPIIFDWTIASAALDALERGEASARTEDGQLLAVRTSQRARTQIPGARRPIYDRLLELDALDLAFLPDTWRSGALMRRAQAELGGVLVILGGGAGVEDLANLYRSAGRPVVPIDAALGAAGDDATVGGQGLARRAQSDPRDFLRLADGSSASARLATLCMDDTRPPAPELARRLLALLDDLEPPRAFCVRLLNPNHTLYSDVERFFRGIAQPVLEESGLRVVDLGHDPQERAWMNTEIFEELHNAEVAFVDLTGCRPNCFIELGYALGRGHRTVITARQTESPPFDADKLPWHFWDPSAPADDARAALREHLRKFGALPPLVRPPVLV